MQDPKTEHDRKVRTAARVAWNAVVAHREMVGGAMIQEWRHATVAERTAAIICCGTACRDIGASASGFSPSGFSADETRLFNAVARECYTVGNLATAAPVAVPVTTEEDDTKHGAASFLRGAEAMRASIVSSLRRYSRVLVTTKLLTPTDQTAASSIFDEAVRVADEATVPLEPLSLCASMDELFASDADLPSVSASDAYNAFRMNTESNLLSWQELAEHERNKWQAVAWMAHRAYYMRGSLMGEHGTLDAMFPGYLHGTPEPLNVIARTAHFAQNILCALTGEKASNPWTFASDPQRWRMMSTCENILEQNLSPRDLYERVAGEGHAPDVEYSALPAKRFARDLMYFGIVDIMHRAIAALRGVENVDAPDVSSGFARPGDIVRHNGQLCEVVSADDGANPCVNLRSMFSALEYRIVRPRALSPTRVAVWDLRETDPCNARSCCPKDDDVLGALPAGRLSELVEDADRVPAIGDHVLRQGSDPDHLDAIADIDEHGNVLLEADGATCSHIGRFVLEHGPTDTLPSLWLEFLPPTIPAPQEAQEGDAPVASVPETISAAEAPATASSELRETDPAPADPETEGVPVAASRPTRNRSHPR